MFESSGAGEANLHPTAPRSLAVAFYKGNRPGIEGLVGRLIRRVDQGPYSHCELLFSDGQSASASLSDGGVRVKRIDYSVVGNWDFLPLNDPTGQVEATALKWAYMHDNDEYDTLGSLRFLSGVLKSNPEKYFCSEAVMEMLGFPEPFRFGPNGAASVLGHVLKTKIQVVTK